MITLSYNDIKNMKDTEKVYVSKNAIYIQILDYEQKYQPKRMCIQELFDLNNIVVNMIKFEYKNLIKRKCVEMTVSEIKHYFKENNYYPKNSFVQYISSKE